MSPPTSLGPRSPRTARPRRRRPCSRALPRAPRLATIQAVAPETMSDGELITLVGEGDPGAFELLYQRYARPVFALALRRLGDRGRAEDAVQETFASIWRSARSYRRER